MRNKFLTILAMSCLTACGTTDVVNGNAMFSPINRDEARIIVERDESLLYMAGAADIEINDKEVASLGRGGSVIHDVRAGENKISASTFGSLNKFTVQLDAEAGKTYEFIVKPRTGNFYLNAGFGIIGEAINSQLDDKSGYFELEMKKPAID